MVATILNSPRAVQMSVYVVRAFVRFREALASHASLARKLQALERSLMDASSQTQRQFQEVYEAIRLLQSDREARKRRPIGFTRNLDEDV
jgi:argininosuccinate lyase